MGTDLYFTADTFKDQMNDNYYIAKEEEGFKEFIKEQSNKLVSDTSLLKPAAMQMLNAEMKVQKLVSLLCFLSIKIVC